MTMTVQATTALTTSAAPAPVKPTIKPLDSMAKAVGPNDSFRPTAAAIVSGSSQAIIPILATQFVLMGGTEGGASGKQKLFSLATNLGGAAVGTVFGIYSDRLSDCKGRVIAAAGLVAGVTAGLVANRMVRSPEVGYKAVVTVAAGVNAGVTAALAANSAMKAKARVTESH